MTDLGLNPALAALAQDARLQWEAGPDGGLVVGESEVKLVVTRDGEDFVIDRISRGAPAGTQLRTRERSAVERYLVSWIGDAWRESHRLPRAVPDSSIAVADIIEGENWDATLTWTEDGRRSTATELNVGAARRLAALLAHDLDALVASYQAPEGRPALVIV
ncbi:hypothetical protein J1G44_06045 [Cellulomonas sp. zg-ZUI199]|uniref:Aminoglycoside phosphotransferase n=1 Tax=Cellulomonas wangleii TaxID=2816956 RepID=A0ABX8D6I5_9CELL|nr:MULTISPECIES: hypothetical protein [Cellulomonas]MBO0898955.1 hypothetical protein [Cellulomonas sp. zg-ZUI22]MBO0923758.1 hypothetical protein [Cellulomonas wangleii]MBO0924040.1 hypothetical protein [Cellulomonas wangleii]QVI62066.1 hypothetical protein KG103_16895 [Cellulomonas wangleii]